MKTLNKLNDACAAIEKVALTIMVSVMLILGMMQVLSRFVFKAPISWSEGMLVYLFIWSSFFGAALGMYYLEHFSIDALTIHLPAKAQNALAGFVYLAIAAFAAYVVYRGTILALDNRTQMMTLMPFSMMVPYLVLPASHLLIFIHVASHFFNLLGKEGTAR